MGHSAALPTTELVGIKDCFFGYGYRVTLIQMKTCYSDNIIIYASILFICVYMCM